MEYRNYSLTGAKQNFGIHYSQERRMSHFFNFNGQYQVAKNPMANSNTLLLPHLGHPEMPSAFASYPMPFAYNTEKNFVNHKKEFSTDRKHYIIKEPIVNKTMNDSPCCGSKGNGGVYSTKCVYVGGYVGSKIQSNIITKKSNACDLIRIISDLLKNIEWGRSEEGITRNKKTEDSLSTGFQNNPSPQFKSTEGSSHKMDVDRNLNFGNIINLSNKNMDRNCDKVNGLNPACLRVKICTEPIKERAEKQNHNIVIKDCLNEVGKEKKEVMEKVCKPLCSTPVPIVENPASDSNNSSRVDTSKTVSFQICGSPVEKVGVLKSEEPQSPECSWKNKICSIPKSRFRQPSESSVDSESDSFVVFDEKCCESTDDEFELLEEMDEFEHLDDDDCDFCSVEEANAKWSAWYNDDDDGSGSNEENRKVKFNDKIIVHLMIAWDYAYRKARIGLWEQMARDRFRFRDRILRLECTLAPILQKDHREKIYKSLYS